MTIIVIIHIIIVAVAIIIYYGPEYDHKLPLTGGMGGNVAGLLVVG